jgi:hypothetical protein
MNSKRSKQQAVAETRYKDESDFTDLEVSLLSSRCSNSREKGWLFLFERFHLTLCTHDGADLVTHLVSEETSKLCKHEHELVILHILIFGLFSLMEGERERVHEVSNLVVQFFFTAFSLVQICEPVILL